MKRFFVLFLSFAFISIGFTQDYPADWNVENSSSVDSTNTIYKTSNTSAWGDAGGHSESSLETIGTGYIKYIVSDIDQQKALGFSTSTTDNKFSSLLFGVFFNNGNVFEIVDGKQGKKIDSIANQDTLYFFYNKGDFNLVRGQNNLLNFTKSNISGALRAKACLKSQQSSFSQVYISFLNLENTFEINAIDLNSDYAISFTYNNKNYHFEGGKTCIFPISKSCGQKDIKVRIENDTTSNQLNVKLGDDVEFEDIYFSEEDSYYFEEVKYSYSLRRVFLFKDKNSSENQVEFRLGLNLENGMLFNPNNSKLKVNDIEGLQGNYTFKVTDQDGSTVFSTTNPSDEWDGKGSDGNLVEIGTYNYEVTINDFSFSGTFLLQY